MKQFDLIESFAWCIDFEQKKLLFVLLVWKVTIWLVQNQNN
jgi:hypothetical protein